MPLGVVLANLPVGVRALALIGAGSLDGGGSRSGITVFPYIMLVFLFLCPMNRVTGYLRLSLSRNDSLLQNQLAIRPVVLEAGPAGLDALSRALGRSARVGVVELVEEIGNLAGLGGAPVDQAGLVGGQSELDVAIAVLVGRGGEDVVGVEVEVLDSPGETALGGLGGGVGGSSGGGGSEGQGGDGAGEVDHFDRFGGGWFGWLGGGD